MDVLMYRAALYCAECGTKIRAELDAAGKRPADPDDEASYDSDDYPKGPFGDGGGEADTPQHCDACHTFLENPLTSEGKAYVCRAVLDDALAGADARGVAWNEWRPFYDVDVMTIARIASSDVEATHDHEAA